MVGIPVVKILSLDIHSVMWRLSHGEYILVCVLRRG